VRPLHLNLVNIKANSHRPQRCKCARREFPLCGLLTLTGFLLLTIAAQAQPIVIAHRGASGYLPEHTLPAKALAHAMGADYLEQDLVLTKDDVPVVMHDIYLDTISDVAQRFPGRHRENGRYCALDFTVAEIKQLKATERFNQATGKAVFPRRFPVGQSTFTIPTLEEELQFIQGLNKSTGRIAGIYPEIKQPKWHRDQGHDISAIVLPILKRYGYATRSDPCFLQCFEFDELKRIRTELGWQGRLVQLLGAFKKGEQVGKTTAKLAEIARVADGIGPAIESDIVALTTQAHRAGLLVHPYTLRVDELPKWTKSTEALLRTLFDEAKVDGLFTDFPDVAVNYLKAR
jgi:glycerophosphoryl diester phosphodiesterase